MTEADRRARPGPKPTGARRRIRLSRRYPTWCKPCSVKLELAWARALVLDDDERALRARKVVAR